MTTSQCHFDHGRRSIRAGIRVEIVFSSVVVIASPRRVAVELQRQHNPREKTLEVGGPR
jgi:hypothetical protein